MVQDTFCVSVLADACAPRPSISAAGRSVRNRRPRRAGRAGTRVVICVSRLVVGIGNRAPESRIACGMRSRRGRETGAPAPRHERGGTLVVRALVRRAMQLARGAMKLANIDQFPWPAAYGMGHTQ